MASIQIEILSLFPDYFRSPFDQSMIGRAKENGIVEIELHNIRDWAEGKHKRVDDRPYGGGPGMVMMAPPVVQAVRAVRTEKSHVVALTPSGVPLTAKKGRELSRHEHLVLVCGHYEGIDSRAIDLEVDEEVSVGDYVLTSGCPAAIVLVDVLCRFIPGVLGHEDAADSDSFERGLIEPHPYTRPEEFEGVKVPEVLLSGDHKAIGKWYREQSIELTRERRPDLFEDKKEDLR